MKKTLRKTNIYDIVRKKSSFFLPLIFTFMKKIKNLKISEETHQLLKKYCDENGLKIYKFLEKLIIDNCKKKKDIYGE
jgi:hypothetical protein